MRTETRMGQCFSVRGGNTKFIFSMENLARSLRESWWRGEGSERTRPGEKRTGEVKVERLCGGRRRLEEEIRRD